MRALPLFCGLLIAGCLAIRAQAATDATQWLERLDKAQFQQGYQGTFVYEQGGSFSTHSIWHHASRTGFTERILQLDGPAQEVVRVGATPLCISTGAFQPMSLPPGVVGGFSDPLTLMSWYDLKVAGYSRVAGRPAVIVTLNPHDPNRYALELYLDQQTGLALKSLLINERGQLLERFQFTHFDPSSPSAQDMAASVDCVAVRDARAPAAEVVPAASLGWRPDWLPAGFELTASSVRPDEASHLPVTHLMYSDGLANVSVFLEPVTGEASDARAQLGATVAVSRRQPTPKGDVMITVVGEVPLGAAERIALSMHPLETQARQ